MRSFPWSLGEIEVLVRTGKLSPEQLVEASAEAIADCEPEVRAWCFLTLESARQRAVEVQRPGHVSEPMSPLHGVPIAVKDIFDTAGIPTEWGSVTQRGRVPEKDCALVEDLYAAGCVLIGKTHTTAFAYFDTGPTRNPLDTGHSPGGSSSGSAAAVAAGMVPLAVGSQTQGSVLRPASFCGVAGFKPSYGRLPLRGVMPFAPTLDHAGLFARSASDLSVAWRALGFDTAATHASAITVLDWPPAGRVEPKMMAAFRSAVQTLAANDLSMRRTALPAFFRAVPTALWTVMAYEAARAHGNHYRRHGAKIGAKLMGLLEKGLSISADEYRTAIESLDSARSQFSAWSQEHPIVATPAALGPAPKGLETSGDPRCNAPFTALGAPSVSIPMPVSAEDLPLGLQLSAGRGSDASLLATAIRCERLLGDSA